MTYGVPAEENRNLGRNLGLNLGRNLWVHPKRLRPSQSTTGWRVEGTTITRPGLPTAVAG